MSNLRAQIDSLAQELTDLCSNISVREDERGTFILAFGLKDVHSLELRRIDDQFELELWHGTTAEEEYIVDKPLVDSAKEAVECAREWLKRDAV